MLLEFRAKNYKSFKDELLFPLFPLRSKRAYLIAYLVKKLGRQLTRAFALLLSMVLMQQEKQIL